MIRMVLGDDSWAREQAVATIETAFPGVAEHLDGSELSLQDLPDLFMATTLFADQRLVVIKGLSENTAVWQDLPKWFARLNDTTEVVLVEEKPDKRTVTFKELKKIADMQEFAAWTDRDEGTAKAWLRQEAEKREVALDARLANLIVERVGVDKWSLVNALEKLVLADVVSEASIKDLIDARPLVNVFSLFDKAVRGQKAELQRDLENLRLSEDPYKLFALLSSQALQLTAVAVAGSSDNPAADFSIPGFVVTRLKTAARNLSRHDVTRIIRAFSDADKDIKTSRGEPWLLLERTLLSIA